MGTNNKFTPNQRKIAWKIYDLKNLQRTARKRVLTLDEQIRELQKEIKEKRW